MFTQKLIERGVEVIRPEEIDHTEKREIDGELFGGFNTYNARDLFFYYDNCIYECPSFCFSR